ncbi:class I SAM-dependent methyltransferase [Saccharopolyspora erythraea]|uniref:class I SAM-dependent methyltransferase n=1 Tax=Saccharopolyspora erythraea TaxID=1836 RepID=UPI001BA5E405|nr:class I SAM-dependent methyltransferase [Saccharopolyspora erythraea]QUH03334.1 class I SAM-dependent methyltransferase [Saccharopolyspora erythraea]
MRLDATGKVSLDQIYTRPDPRPYFRTLRDLGYCIPQLAKQHFAELVREYRESTGVRVPTILDIGCSYGINAALLQCDLTIDDLYEHYCDQGADERDRDWLLARDRELVRSRGTDAGMRFVGLDSSGPALSYALSAGFLDGAVHADLETRDPTPGQRAEIARADLVISTGCVGYVGERTLSAVAGAHGVRKPWMAHFVLRMFPFDPIADRLAEAGYETESLPGLYRQRRFASPEEQSQVLDTLSRAGVDPRGLEAEGWFYARLFVSRPRVAAASAVAEPASPANNDPSTIEVEDEIEQQPSVVAPYLR